MRAEPKITQCSGGCGKEFIHITRALTTADPVYVIVRKPNPSYFTCRDCLDELLMMAKLDGTIVYYPFWTFGGRNEPMVNIASAYRVKP